MALVPCKVCGSLNSDEAELCLSCGYPPQGRKRPAIFQWAAFIVLAMLALPLLLSLASRFQPSTPAPLQEEPSKNAVIKTLRS